MVKENQATTEAEFFLMLEDAVGGKRRRSTSWLRDRGVIDGRAKTEVKMKVGGEVLHEISEGVGPVHAMTSPSGRRSQRSPCGKAAG